MHQIWPPWFYIINFDVTFYVAGAAGSRVSYNLTLFVTNLHQRWQLAGVAILIADQLVEDFATTIDDISGRDNIRYVNAWCCVQHHRTMNACIVEEIERVGLHQRDAIVSVRYKHKFSLNIHEK